MKFSCSELARKVDAASACPRVTLVEGEKVESGLDTFRWSLLSSRGHKKRVNSR